jgi:hypothetical protein
MAYLDWLEQTLATRLADKPIGEPVAVRAFFQLSEDHGLLQPALAEAAAAAARWLNARPTRLFAQGGAAAGYVSALVEFAGGQTALLTSEARHPSGPSLGESEVLVLILGNHGTLRYNDQPGAGGIAFPALPATSSRYQPWAAAIERSLRTGRAVEVTGA